MKRKSLVAPKTLNTKALLKQLGPETETRIDLTEKKIGNEGLLWLATEVLPKRKNVKELELFGNDINDDGVDILVDILKKNYKIHTVKLQFNNITAVGAETLAGHLRIDEALVRLDLYGNKIGDAGCESLARALARNNSLTSLGLFGCKIGNKGGTALVRYIENNKTIKVVNVDNNDIDDDLVEAISAYCARNNGEEYEVPASIYTFLQQFPEEDKRKSLKPGAVVTPVTATVSPITPSESPRASLSSPNAVASQPVPSMPAVSNITEKLINSFAKSNTEAEYSGERKEMIEKMTMLVKDKEALTAHIAQLRQEIEKLQQKNNHLEQFVFSIKRGFNALEREYPIPE